MKDDYEPLGLTIEEDWPIIGDDQGLDYLGSEFTGS